QSSASPSSAQYWHIGETAIRLRSATPRIASGVSKSTSGRFRSSLTVEEHPDLPTVRTPAPSPLDSLMIIVSFGGDVLGGRISRRRVRARLARVAPRIAETAASEQVLGLEFRQVAPHRLLVGERVGRPLSLGLGHGLEDRLREAEVVAGRDLDVPGRAV